MKKDYEGPLYAPWWKVVAGRKNRPKVNDGSSSVLNDTEVIKKQVFNVRINIKLFFYC